MTASNQSAASSEGVNHMHGKKRGGIWEFTGNVHFWREIFAILRGNVSFRYISVFFLQKCLKMCKIFTF